MPKGDISAYGQTVFPNYYFEYINEIESSFGSAELGACLEEDGVLSSPTKDDVRRREDREARLIDEAVQLKENIDRLESSQREAWSEVELHFD